MKTADDGWSVFLLCHGNTTKIGGLTGAELADKLSPVLPATSLGFIHLQSCATGVTPASELADALGKKGHNLLLKAPSANATFTEEIGFRVLDVNLYTAELKKEYGDLIKTHEATGKKLAGRSPGGDLKAFCKTVYDGTKDFWTAFSTLFRKCALPLGGWNGYETTPPTGAKKL